MQNSGRVMFEVTLLDGQVGHMTMDAYLAEDGDHVWWAVARHRQHREDLPRGRIRSIEKTLHPE